MRNGNNMENLMEQCLEYFRNRPVYRKLFAKVKSKYESLGHFGGTVTLTGLTIQEKQELGGFLQKDYTENKTVSVSAVSLEKALKSSRFARLDWEEILEAYYGETLVGKKEQKLLETKRCEDFWGSILESCPNDSASEFLREVLMQKKEGYFFLMQQYKENKEELKKLLKNFTEAVIVLAALRETGKKELLPVFAAASTGNPHYFDEGTTAEKLLSLYLRWRFGTEKQEGLSKSEYKKKLFFEAGILKDELSNDVLVYGIRAWRRDGSVHEGIDGFFRCREVMKLTLKTLGSLGVISGTEKCVYVVENPAIFSSLVDKYPESTFVCGNGQLTLAVFVLLDKLAEHHMLYYAGDFDPEGLQIAANIKNRYKEKVVLWNYRPELYEKYSSDVILNERRLKKLEKIEERELKEIKELMRSRKHAAYQETMLEEYRLIRKISQKY